MLAKVMRNQIGMIIGLMIGDLASGTVFHALTWFYKRSKRTFKSIASAEVIGKITTADEEIILKQAYRKLLGVTVTLDCLSLWILKGSTILLLQSVYQQKKQLRVIMHLCVTTMT